MHRTLSQAIDNSDCVHIPALDVLAGVALNTVVSDSDDYDAVLPLAAVKSVSIYQAAKLPAAAQDRPATAAAIVAAVTAQWQRANSAPPPSLPAVGPGAAAAVSPASPAGATAPSITPGAVQRGAPVNPAASGGSSTGAVAASVAVAGPAAAPSAASRPVQNGAPIYTSASAQSGGGSMIGSAAQGGNAPGQVTAASNAGGEKAGQVQASQVPGGSPGQPASSLGNRGGSGGVDLPPYPDYG